jgi:hypothetical protein
MGDHMSSKFIISLLTSFLFTITANALEPSFVADIILSPAGSFKVESKKVKGTATRKDDEYTAKDVTVDLRALKTGVSLRDNHTKDKLEVPKYPEAKLISASGKGGKGKAKISIKGKTVDVEGTYKEEKGFIVAKFEMSLESLDIKKIRYMGVGVKDKVNVTVTIPIQK